jgi:hypothetical protein
MKQFRLHALLLCSILSSGCYLVTQGRPENATNSGVQVVLPGAMALAVVFVVIGVAVALQAENNERRNAALGITAGATAVFLVLLG